MQQMNFYCRSYCLLNMFRAPLCPSSGAREQTRHTTLSSTPYRQIENQAPNTTGSNHLYNTLELLMMGIMVPETCWASNKICNKNSSVASSRHFISTYYRRCTVKSTSNFRYTFQYERTLSVSWPHATSRHTNCSYVTVVLIYTSSLRRQ